MWLSLGLSFTAEAGKSQTWPQPQLAVLPYRVSTDTPYVTQNASTGLPGAGEQNVETPRFKRYTLNVVGGGTSAYSDSTQGGTYWRATLTRHSFGKVTTQFSAAHYTQQDISERFGFATDTSLNIAETQASVSVLVQKNAGFKLTTTALFRTTSSGSSYMLRPEAVVTVLDPISIVFAMRPTYDELQRRWSNAAEFGAHIQLPYQQSLSARMIQTSRRYLQSPVTALVDYEGSIKSIFEVRAGFAQGNGGVFRFDSGWGIVTGKITSNFGLTAEYKQRNGTFARKTLGAGLFGRF